MIPCNVVYDPVLGELLIRVPVGEEPDVVVARISVVEGVEGGSVAESALSSAELVRLGRRS